MTVQSTSTTRPVLGEYRVVKLRQGLGIDGYLRVSGPDGRTSEQKVYCYPSMTPLQVAEGAVAGHLGADGAHQAATVTSRQDHNDGGFVVELA